jgi:hypothetical protein
MRHAGELHVASMRYMAYSAKAVTMKRVAAYAVNTWTTGLFGLKIANTALYKQQRFNLLWEHGASTWAQSLQSK